MTAVYAMQGDTLDTVADRYFKNNSVDMLPALIELNPELDGIFLAEHQAIKLPEPAQAQTAQTLKLWD